MEDKDRRRAPRLEADGEVNLTFLGSEETCKGQLNDISKNGIFITLADQPQQHWLNAGCTFQLVSTIEEVTYNIKGQAHVTRLTPTGMGLFLTTINPPSRRNFVKLMIHVMDTLSKLL